MDIYDLDKDTLQFFWREKNSLLIRNQMNLNTSIDMIIDENLKLPLITLKNNEETRNAKKFDVKI
jgi:hypothetical protein